MSNINILDSSVYNKISAGEVVERPSSVVKELVENSIDAGADSVSVEIFEGGIRSVRVADNGSGMDGENLKKAFLPHATSKILRAEDLFTVSSLGFRGEALASIAAVGIVEVVSKTADDDAARKVEIKDGIFGEIGYAAANPGTSITVSDLFYNAKPRLNFLKRAKTEENYISSLVAKFILAYPDVAFNYKADGKMIYQTKGSGLKNAVYEVYGREISDNLMEIEYRANASILRGYISVPGYYKSNKSYQTTFINGRIVENQAISLAVLRAYGESIMKRCFPIFILDMILPFGDVDVNAHPTKNDVRFADEKSVFSFVFHAVQNRVKAYIADGEKEFYMEDGGNLYGESEESSSRERNTDAENSENFYGERNIDGGETGNFYGKKNIDGGETGNFYGENSEDKGGVNFENLNLDAIKNLERDNVSFGIRPKNSNNRLSEGALRITSDNFFPDGSREFGDIFGGDFSDTAEKIGGGVDKKFSDISEKSDNNSNGMFQDTPEKFGNGLDKTFSNMSERLDGGSDRIFQNTPQKIGGGLDGAFSNMPEKLDGGSDRMFQNTPEKFGNNLNKAFSNMPEKFRRDIDITEKEEKNRSKTLNFIEYGRLVGQVLNCYVIFEYLGEVYLVDQHAVHERINYDRLKSRERRTESQIFLVPYVFSVNHAEKNVLDGLTEYLNELGFDIEYFGGGDFKISAAPVDIDLKKFIADLLSEIKDIKSSKGYLTERIIQTACKASIKSGDGLNDAQLSEFVKLLKNHSDIAPTCPHGRPVFIKMTRTELDKMFKRIV
jgi:DNA mismatch repair protein MutL